MPDLLPRVLTALVLIPLVFLGIFFLSPFSFSIVSAVVFLIAAWEWAKISGFYLGLPDRPFRYSETIAPIIYVALTAFFLFGVNKLPLMEMLSLGAVLWLFAFLSFFYQIKNFEMGSGPIMLAVCWKAINYLCFLSPHPYKLLTLFLIIWLADTAAYFIGSQFGKHKLAPTISPGKSIEGAVGAIIIVGIVIGLIFHSVPMVILSIITVIVSIIGDLFESLMKRKAGVKDSGKILPGHGGILDRLDSLIAAAPVFALGMMWIH